MVPTINTPPDFERLMPLLTANETASIFVKENVVKIMAVYETVEIIGVVMEKVTVCMDDNCIFCSGSCSVRGPLDRWIPDISLEQSISTRITRFFYQILSLGLLSIYRKCSGFT